MEPLIDLSRFASALIIKPSSLGDIVHALPAVHAIKKAHPHLNVRWMANPEWLPLFDGNQDITDVIPFPRKQFKGLSALPGLLLWARRLNAMYRELPELALDFQGLLRSGLLGVARGAEPLLGMSDAREGASVLYRHVVAVDSDDHAVDRYLAVPRALGIAVDRVHFPLPEGVPPQAKLPEKYLLVHPYSRGTGKSMRRETLQALCDCLAPRPIVIVGRCEKPEAITGAHVTSLVNQTDLLELMWVIRQCFGCISVDSGPMHLAAALAPMSLGIHTRTNPRKVGPYNTDAWVWKAGRVAHRQDFTDDEVQTHQSIEPSDARRMADFVLREWF